ncbi:MAG TPA: MMPL family transporter [Acidimicrobiales bacterium]|nr:MMPL family transporter [Acidimicrobiales bacterium]
MRRTWEWLGLNLGKHAGAVVCIALGVTILLGFGLGSVRIDTGNSDYLNANDPLAVGNNEYSSLFGGDPIAVVFTMKPGKTVDDLLTPANQAEMTHVDTELAKNPSVYDVISPESAFAFSSTLQEGSELPAQMFVSAYQRDRSPRSRAIRQAYAVAEGTALAAIPPDQRVLSNPRWMSFVLHDPDGSLRSSVKAFVPDDRHVLMAIFLKPNLGFNQELAAARTIESITSHAQYQGATTITTGVPEIEKDVNDYVTSGLRTLVTLAALIMALILLIAFRVRWRLLPFAVLAVGMIWAFGLVGYIGVPLSFATLTAIPVLMGIGMDYSIQMHARIEEEVRVTRAAHPIQAAARGLGPALLIVTFDAVFAFAALWFSKVPAVRQFGSLMVIGIVAVCLCSLLLTLAILGIREYRSPTPAVDRGSGALGRAAVRLSSLPARCALPVMILAALVFVSGLALEGRLVIQPDPIKWLDPHSVAVRQIDTLEAVTGSDNQIGVIVKTAHPFSTQTVNYVTNLTETEDHRYRGLLYPGAGLVSSADAFLTVPGADVVPPTAAQMKQFYELAPAQLQRVMVGDGGHALNVVFLSRTNDFSALEPIIDNLRQNAPPPAGITVAPGGIGVVSVGLLQNLAASRAELTYLALAFVAAFLAIRLRSVVRSLLSLTPVLIAVGGVTLGALAMHVTLSPLTAVSGPLVVAICTEFTSLLLLRFVEERGRGRSPREAMQVTAARTGRAFMVSALTAFAGIVVVATSSMPMLRDFGIVMALNVAVALLSALVVLPPVLVWAEEAHRWVSRGLLRPAPPPIEFERAMGVPVAHAVGDERPRPAEKLEHVGRSVESEADDSLPAR